MQGLENMTRGHKILLARMLHYERRALLFANTNIEHAVKNICTDHRNLPPRNKSESALPNGPESLPRIWETESSSSLLRVSGLRKGSVPHFPVCLVCSLLEIAWRKNGGSLPEKTYDRGKGDSREQLMNSATGTAAGELVSAQSGCKPPVCLR